MENSRTVKIPLLNPNEPEAKIVSLAVEEGQYVSKDSILCVLESTKSTAEVIAETDGYVVSLQLAENDLAQAGAILCYLTNNPDWRLEIPDLDVDEEKTSSATSSHNTDLPDGLRISQPALKLARQWEVELSSLPIGPLVTEKTIRDIKKKHDFDITKVEIDPQQLVVYGGGGHGKSVIDAIRSQSKYTIHGVVDDGLVIGSQVLDVPVLGGGDILPQLYQQGIGQAVNAVGGIGDIRSRISIFQQLSMQNFLCPTIIHASAVVEDSADLSFGIQVFPLAYIGSQTYLGYGVIINTSAVVSHDCHLADYVNISPGALLAGGVRIGRGTLVGMGATINLGVSIGENVRIGNGATIKSDVPNGSIVRAGMIWPE